MFLFARLLGFRHVDDAGTLVCGTVWDEREFVLEAVQRNGPFGDAAVAGRRTGGGAHKVHAIHSGGQRSWPSGGQGRDHMRNGVRRGGDRWIGGVAFRNIGSGSVLLFVCDDLLLFVLEDCSIDVQDCRCCMACGEFCC